MHAVQLANFGVENIELRDVADAEAAAGEVLIATEAATINPADYGMVTGGWRPSCRPLSPPRTPQVGISPARSRT